MEISLENMYEQLDTKFMFPLRFDLIVQITVHLLLIQLTFVYLLKQEIQPFN